MASLPIGSFRRGCRRATRRRAPAPAAWRASSARGPATAEKARASSISRPHAFARPDEQRQDQLGRRQPHRAGSSAAARGGRGAGAGRVVGKVPGREGRWLSHEMGNPKYEVRNLKQIQNSKLECPRPIQRKTCRVGRAPRAPPLTCSIRFVACPPTASPRRRVLVGLEELRPHRHQVKRFRVNYEEANIRRLRRLTQIHATGA